MVSSNMQIFKYQLFFSIFSGGDEILTKSDAMKHFFKSMDNVNTKRDLTR